MKTEFYKTDDLKLVTREQLEKDFNNLKESGDLADYEDINVYTAACQSYNNGILTKISAEDAREITVDTVYYTQGNYGEISHTGKHYTEYIFVLKDTIDNAKEIKWEGVNNVIVNEDENTIIQASGYTRERGLFCDLY